MFCKSIYDALGNDVIKLTAQDLLEAPESMTIPVAAELLGVRPSTIYRWRKAGQIEFVDRGSTLMVTKSAIAKMLGVDLNEAASRQSAMGHTGVLVPVQATLNAEVIFNMLGEPAELVLGSQENGKRYKLVLAQ